MDWVIFYADGSTFSSDDGPPEDAPRRYVELVMQRTNEGRELLHGSGNGYLYFCWQDGQWIAHSQVGLEQYLDLPGKEKVRLCGFWIADDKFRVLWVRAVDHPAFKHLPLRVVP